MRYLSVCSGIEAATCAWHPLGWTPVAFSQFDPEHKGRGPDFASAVLAHHYPTVPNYGDMTKFQEWPDAALDLLVGGTPCQSFSVAGLRAGMADPRGNLALTFLAIADRYRPRWVVWENVPGVLSSVSHAAPDPCPPPPPMDLGCDGAEMDTEDEYESAELHAFQSLVAGFSELGYFGAYGTLDAQYAGLAQRRKRVFAVFHLGDWHRAAAVLFDRASLSGHPAPRREAGQVAPTVPARRSAGGGLGTDFDCDGGLIPSTGDISHCLNAGGMGRIDYESETLITHAFDARQSDVIQYGDQAGPLDTNGHSMAVAFYENQRGELTVNDTAGALGVGGGKPGQGYPAVAFQSSQSGMRVGDTHATLDSNNGSRRHHGALVGMQVRRLTPRECERLQGFPDDYTAIPYRGKLAADGNRYKALGNSMAVPVMRWIGERIQQVDAIQALERSV